MKYLKSFRIFENLNNSMKIEQFVKDINLPENKREVVINWWNKNRNHIKIHYFSFAAHQPIGGVFLGVDEIAVNSKLPMPPHIKLFLALHESAHCDQHRENRFMAGYYDTVVEGKKEEFLTNYKELEKEANDFAINSMKEMGFGAEIDREEMRLRGNERAGDLVYKMMTEDIRKFQATDFIDLLKKQILPAAVAPIV